MKYIIVTNWEEDSSFGMMDVNESEQIIMFPNGITHKVIFTSLKSKHPELKVVSAGFVSKDKDNRLVCHGESHSLGVKSRDSVDTIRANIGF